jgi:hypothetical protein
VKQLIPWLVWLTALFWLWLLLVGEWDPEQFVAAAIAAAIAASLAEFARQRTGFSARLTLSDFAALPRAFGMVFVDFAILAWALFLSAARRRVVRGEFVSREFEGGSALTRGVGPRALAVLVASYSPNAYVVDLDLAKRRVLLHELVRHRASEEPV